METDSRNIPHKQRLRIFVDFWNFQLALNSVAPAGFRPDWKILSSWLTEQAALLVFAGSGETFQFEGAHVYLSFDPKSEKDRKLRQWSMNVLDRIPGVQVVCKERKWKGHPVCQSCHQEIDHCPHCNAMLSRTVEKGIDTAIVADMIKLAWEDAWDVAVLVSSDRDYIPAVEFLNAKGHKVINAGFFPQGIELARTCWAAIDLKQHFSDFERTQA